jgi:hypothetical protein
MAISPVRTAASISSGNADNSGKWHLSAKVIQTYTDFASDKTV